MTPVLTEVPRPSGLPMAITGSPSFKSSLLPKRNVGSCPGKFTLSKARSIRFAAAINCAGNVGFVVESDPDQRGTLNDMLTLLVTMIPDGSMIDPVLSKRLDTLVRGLAGARGLLGARGLVRTQGLLATRSDDPDVDDSRQRVRHGGGRVASVRRHGCRCVGTDRRQCRHCGGKRGMEYVLLRDREHPTGAEPRRPTTAIAVGSSPRFSLHGPLAMVGFPLHR